MSAQPRKRRTQAVAVSMTALAISVCSGCVAGREFRQAALPGLHTGVSQILDGIVDGFFAAIQPEPETD